MFVVVVTKNGNRNYDSILYNQLFSDKENAKIAIFEEESIDKELNQRYYYNIVEVKIKENKEKDNYFDKYMKEDKV